jgi:hypothetical protein
MGVVHDEHKVSVYPSPFSTQGRPGAGAPIHNEKGGAGFCFIAEFLAKFFFNAHLRARRNLMRLSSNITDPFRSTTRINRRATSSPQYTIASPPEHAADC